MRASSTPSVPTIVASFLLFASCGGKGGVDGGSVVADGAPSSMPDGNTTSTGGNSGTLDASSAMPPDTPPVAAGAKDGGAMDWISSDRAYLPAQSPDGSIPDCVWSLLRQCCAPPGDFCVEALWDGGAVDESLCWPTGERETYDNHTFILKAYSADGTVCFTRKPKVPADGTYVFYDTTGEAVATYRNLSDGIDQVEVSCDGATYRATGPLECSTVLGLRGGCHIGFCPR